MNCRNKNRSLAWTALCLIVLWAGIGVLCTVQKTRAADTVIVSKMIDIYKTPASAWIDSVMTIDSAYTGETRRRLKRF